ncbi:FAD-binding oxidoreductase [Sinimarinibacterium thermocellulolyticum]|uniref:FAD-binding oxidoreductase n=1 Tax=Sinimarinibacterium thermocellulolyticum TaxID=3170016 RepID=A0ABV2A6X9_9GAMM
MSDRLPQTLARLRAVVGDGGWIDDPAAMAPFLEEQRGRYRGRAAAVVAPASTDEVARVLALCNEARLGVVPQGGNTGLCGGAVAAEGQIILSLRRMRRIRALDARNRTLTAEAGCILADVQSAAAAAGRLFPLSLAAEGSCQIGGNLATNAGGTNALRYGVARDLTLGIEVVLADGSVWDGLSTLKKDNTGYDLRDLFIGSEGTLGVITAATLRLFPRPGDVQTALLALDDVDRALAVLDRLQDASDGRVNACELMGAMSVAFAVRHVAGCRAPFATLPPWLLLVEISGGRAVDELRPLFEATLAEALQAGEIADAVLAESRAQAQAFWRLRESIPEAQKFEGGSIKHDVSVPVSAVPAFLRRAGAAVEAALPGVRVCPFGHLGDGNIHFNVSQPIGADRAAFLAEWERCNRIVHDIVAELGGSFSAEHGIGRLKRDALRRYKSPVAVEAMRRIKQALDPNGILNPGALL